MRPTANTIAEAVWWVFSGWAPTVLLDCGGFGAEEAVFGATAPPFASVQSAPAGFASVIIANFPALFDEIGRRRFALGGATASMASAHTTFTATATATYALWL
jgi:hypothetical protein